MKKVLTVLAVLCLFILSTTMAQTGFNKTKVKDSSEPVNYESEKVTSVSLDGVNYIDKYSGSSVTELSGNVLNFDLAASTSTFASLSGASAFTWLGTPDNDEDLSAATNIGFPFTYCGTAFTQFQVSSNGYIRLGSNHDEAVPPVGTLAVANLLSGRNRQVIAPFWDDLAVVSSAADITYKLEGTAPNQVLTVEWKNVKWNWSSTTAATFQVALYQANNSIQFRYGAISGTPVSPSASIGLNDLTPISYQPTVSTNGHAASGKFMSVAMGGTTGARKWHRSMDFEYNIHQIFPDDGTVLTFTPFTVTPYSGTLTVPGTFATPSDAAVRLNVCGISGPTTLTFGAGTYDDIFHLVMVPGLAANSLLINGSGATFAPRGGQYSSNTITAGDQMMRIAGCKNVTIDGISFVDDNTLTTTTAKYDIGLSLVSAQVWSGSTISGSGSQNNVIKNVTINMNAMIPTVVGHGNSVGIRFGTAFSITDPAFRNNFNTIQDVDITGFWRSAIFMYGQVGTNGDVGNKITAVTGRNKLHDVTIVAPGVSSDIRPIEMNAQNDFIIEKTDIYNIQSDVNTTNGIMGIRVNPAAGGDGFGGTCYIRDVKIDNLTMPQTTVTTALLTGIELNFPTLPGTVVHIYNNSISNLFNNGNSTGSTRAMLLNMGNTYSTSYVYNNLIYDIKGPRLTGSPAVRSFDLQAASVVGTFYLWNNTAYIDNAVPPTIANQSSCNLYIANFGIASVELKNNIFVNTMSAGTAPTTGRACNIFASANINLLRIAASSNNNLYYAGTPSANKPIVWDAATAFQTLAAYQAGVATGGLGGPRELQSVTEMPPFVSSVSPYNVNINTASGTQANNGGLPITSPIAVTTDYAGTARSATFPDIGGYEFAGTSAPDVTGPNVVYTALTNTALTSNRTLTAKITDVSGIGSGSNLPRLYYKKNFAGTLVNDAAPTVSGSDYTWTLNYALLDGGSVAAGDTIWYYVAAQDGAGTPNLTADPSGATGTNPPGTVPFTATSAGFRAYKIINSPMSGTYTVGTTAFNKLTGLNLYTEKRVRKVIERVPEPKEFNPVVINAPVGNVLVENTDPTANYSFDSELLKFHTDRFIMKEVEQEYYVLMKDGKEYTGPTFIPFNEGNIEGIYATITLAFNDLNERGVNGAVTLSLVDATYPSETYPLTLNSIAGVSAVNTITIKPAATLTPTISGANGTSLFRIINTGYVTFDGSNSGGTDRSLTLTNTAAGGSLIHFLSQNSVTVNNSTAKNLVLNAGSNTASNIGMWDVNGSGNAGYFNNVTIQNNDFRIGRQAIFINGGVGPQYFTNLTISDNNLANTGANQLKLYGIYFQGVDGATISNNDVGNFESATAEADRGIWAALGSKNVTIEKNKIHDMSTGAGFGANGIYISTALQNANILVKNNLIYGMLGPGSNTVNQNPLGIFITTHSSGNKIYNNSIFLDGATLSNTGSSGAAYSAGVSLSSFALADVRNNVIYNRLGKTPASTALNGQMCLFAFNNSDQFVNLDNNVYYISQVNSTYASIGHINGISDLFLAPSAGLLTYWQSVTGKDANSLYGDPKFVSLSPVDLHIATNTGTPCESGGTPLAEVTTDFDGNTRNNPPDIGADEFSGSKFMTLTLTAMIQGFYNGTTMVTDTMKIQVRNTTAPYAIIDSAYAVLNSSGVGVFNFRDPIVGTNYLLGTSHRNALVTSNNLAGNAFSAGYALSYNFTSAQSQANGNNLVQVGTKWCLYVGDVNRDGVIDLTDVSAVDTDNLNFVGGYVATDCNGDTVVDISDVSLVDTNNINFISQQVPWSPPYSKKLKNNSSVNNKVVE